MPSFLEKCAATRQQLLRKKSAKRIQKQTGGRRGRSLQLQAAQAHRSLVAETAERFADFG